MSDKTEYKIVLSDLDGTLIIKGKDIVPEVNVEAIKKVREKGVKFIICSARSIQLAKPILEQIGSYNLENEYSCLVNGALLIENTGKIIKYKGLPFNLVKEIFEFGKQYDVMFQCYSTDKCYTMRTIDAEIERKKVHHEEYEDITWEQFETLKDKEFGKVLYTKFDLEYLKNISKDVEKKFGDQIEICFSANRYLEMSPKGISKGSALKDIAEYLNVDLKNTIVVGDDFNDLSMIEIAGLGCCVANAKNEVKEKSKYVCEKNNEEGGVAEILDKFILNN